jgi:hypothetical protein
MVDERRLPDPSPGNDCNDVDIPFCPCTIQKSYILLPTKNIPSGNGRLAMEIFSGGGFAGRLRVTACEAADGFFCKL